MTEQLVTVELDDLVEEFALTSMGRSCKQRTS